MKLAQLSTIKLHLAMLTVELLTVQTSYFRESNTNYIRNFVSKFHPALQRTGEVLPVTPRPGAANHNPKDGVGVRSERLSPPKHRFKIGRRWQP